jgi:magnesium-transporting ATPase (P-type)
LSAIVVTQVVNVFLCRSSSRSVLKINPFDNRLILFGVAVEIAVILFIDYTPAGNALFRTAPIPFAAWLSMFPLALAMLVLEELRKWLVRKKCAVIPNHRKEHLGKTTQGFLEMRIRP